MVQVVGAAVGVVSTVSSLNNQRRQASEQRSALEQQAAYTEGNTKIQLANLQRQRDHADFQNRIDTMRRAQARLEDNASLSMAALEDQMNASIANQQAQGNFALGQQQINNDTQRTLGSANNQYAVSSMQNMNAYNYNQGDIGIQSNFALGDIDNQAAQQLTGIEAERLQGRTGALNQIGQADTAEFQGGTQARQFLGGAYKETKGATDALTQAIGQLMNGAYEQKNNAASAFASVAARTGGSGGLSRSALSQAGQGVDQLLDSLASVLTTGSGGDAEAAIAQLGIDKQTASQLLSLVGTQSDTQRKLATNQASIADISSQGSRLQSLGQAGKSRSQTMYQTNLGRLQSRDEYVLNQLAAQDERQLVGMSAQENQSMSYLNLLDEYGRNRLNTGDAQQLNQIGYQQARSARDIQFGIDEAQSGLQRTYYDNSLQSAGTNVRVQSAAELAQIRAGQAAAKSPGLLSYAAALGQAAPAVYPLISNRNAPAQPNQRTGSTMPMAGGVQGTSYTNAPSYSFLQNYKIRGY